MSNTKKIEMIALLTEMLETHLMIREESGQKLFKKNTLALIEQALQCLLADVIVGC